MTESNPQPGQRPPSMTIRPSPDQRARQVVAMLKSRPGKKSDEEWKEIEAEIERQIGAAENGQYYDDWAQFSASQDQNQPIPVANYAVSPSALDLAHMYLPLDAAKTMRGDLASAIEQYGRRLIEAQASQARKVESDLADIKAQHKKQFDTIGQFQAEAEATAQREAAWLEYRAVLLDKIAALESDLDRVEDELLASMADTRRYAERHKEQQKALRLANDEIGHKAERIKAQHDLIKRKNEEIAQLQKQLTRWAETAKEVAAQRDRHMAHAQSLASELAAAQREYYTSDQTRPALLAEIERLRIELTAAQSQIGFSEAERRDIFLSASRVSAAAEKLESILAQGKELAEAAAGSAAGFIDMLAIGAEVQKRRMRLQLLGVSEAAISQFERRAHEIACITARSGLGLWHIKIEAWPGQDDSNGGSSV